MSSGFTKLTPVLTVERILPCLPFWTERLGFTKVAEVPGPDGEPQFALLSKDEVTLMYQTWLSAEEGAPEAVSGPRGHSTMLYLDVTDLNAVARAMEGVPLVASRHDTFYGTEEFSVREPGGAVVTFAMDKK